jgi:hypothetical protein
MLTYSNTTGTQEILDIPGRHWYICSQRINANNVTGFTAEIQSKIQYKWVR